MKGYNEGFCDGFLKGMFHTRRQEMVLECEDLGSDFCVDGGQLMCRARNTDGTVDEWFFVEEFLPDVCAVVNNYFGTSFKPNEGGDNE